jgi:hypothetical protein
MEPSLLQRFMYWYDARWRRKHNVEKIDELISLSFEEYRGDRHPMNDGTWIESGDRLAILHFNRECFDQGGTSARDYARSGLRFRKLLMNSFTQLATQMNSDERLRDVKAFHGISWIPPHGEKLGFLIEPVPDSLVNTIRKFYFKILLKAFFPTLAARENNRLQPHAYWLTRQHLFKYFSNSLRANENESGNYQKGSRNNENDINTKWGNPNSEADASKASTVKSVIHGYS